MKLSILFLLIAVAAIYCGSQAGNFALLILFGYLAISFVILGAGYAVNSPKIFLKTADGKIPVSSLCLLWPYLLLSHLSLKLFRLTSRENPLDEILPGLYLGSRLGTADEKEIAGENIQSVLDVTAEFAEVKYLRTVSNYRCIPVLDHCPPTSQQLQEGIAFIKDNLPSGPVFIHCALGHGRSATFMAAYLTAAGIADSAENAVALLRKKRPGVKLNASQIAALRQFHESRTTTRRNL